MADFNQSVAKSKTWDEFTEQLDYNEEHYLAWFVPGEVEPRKIKLKNIVFPGQTVTKVTELTDTPNTFLGQAGKMWVVKEDESGFEYRPVAEVTGVDQATFDALETRVQALEEEDFTTISENQYGTHPAFTNQHDLNIWILQNIGSDGSGSNDYVLPTTSFDENYLFLLNPEHREVINESQITLSADAQNASEVDFYYKNLSGTWNLISAGSNTSGRIWEATWTPSEPALKVKAVATYADTSIKEVENIIYSLGIEDNFTDTNGVLIASHTPDLQLNSGWEQISGTWEIQNNRLTDSSATSGVHFLLTEGAENAVVDFNISQFADNSATTQLTLRYIDENNHIRAIFSASNSTNLKIYKMEGGVGSDITGYDYTYNYGDVIRFSVVDDTLMIYDVTNDTTYLPIDLPPAINGTKYGVNRSGAVGNLYIDYFKLSIFDLPKINNSVSYSATKNNAYVLEKNQVPPLDQNGIAGTAFYKVGTTNYAVFPVKNNAGDFAGLMYATAPENDPHNWTRNNSYVLAVADGVGSTAIPDVTCHWDGATLTVLYSDFTTGILYYAQGSDIENLIYQGVFMDKTSENSYLRHPDIIKHDGVFYLYLDTRLDRPAGHFGNIVVCHSTTIEGLKTSPLKEVFSAPGFYYEYGDIVAPSVRYNTVNGYFEMAYAGFSSGDQPYPHEIGIAISKHPLNQFERISSEPLIASNPVEGSQDIQVAQPVWYLENNIIYYLAKDVDFDGFDGIKYVDLT